MDAIGDLASFVYKEVKCEPIVPSLVADQSIWQSQTVETYTNVAFKSIASILSSAEFMQLQADKLC